MIVKYQISFSEEDIDAIEKVKLMIESLEEDYDIHTLQRYNEIINLRELWNNLYQLNCFAEEHS